MAVNVFILCFLLLYFTLDCSRLYLYTVVSDHARVLCYMGYPMYVHLYVHCTVWCFFMFGYLKLFLAVLPPRQALKDKFFWFLSTFSSAGCLVEIRNVSVLVLVISGKSVVSHKS